MTVEQLKSVLVHNATDPNAVDASVVDEQLASAASLRRRLDDHGGVILGDEVGAGKTFVTFAVLADTLLRQPRRGATIFVPSDPLTRKWSKQLRAYLQAALIDRDAGDAMARRVVVMDRSMHVKDVDGNWRRPRSDDIVITQHSVFSRQTSEHDRVRCVNAWLNLRYKQVSGGSRAPRRRLFKACELDSAMLDDPWGTWAWEDVLKASVLKPLDRVWLSYASGDRDLRNAMRDAVLDVRREVGRRVLPDLALVVIDEAHNLRSTTSQVYRSLAYVLDDRFDGMLFLTATPFQLGRQELRNVVEFFRTARVNAGGNTNFDERVARMEAGMDVYVRSLAEFSAAWADLTHAEVLELERVALDADASTLPAGRGRIAFERFRAALGAKGKLEAGLRPFLLRTVRERHHIEHEGVNEISPQSRVPVALVDRLISERLSSGGRTFVASALTSACSSWEALFDASIAQSEATTSTLAALNAMRTKDLLGPHPKMQSTLEQCRAAAWNGEKTLVFVERTVTGQVLRDQLIEALGKGLDAKARARLQVEQRFGWPSLRENYLHTLFPDVFGVSPKPAEVLRSTRSPYATALWHRVDVEGPLNYKIAKRLVEHVVFRDAAEEDPDWRERVASAHLRRSSEHVLDEDYVLNGLDLRSGSSTIRLRVPAHPQREAVRELPEGFVRAFAAYQSPWASSVEWLRHLSPEARADLVDAAAAAIATSHLQAEIERQEVAGDPEAHFRQTDRLLTAPKGLWRARFEAIAKQAADLVAASGENADERVLGLAAALRHGERVIFVHGGTPNDTKQRAIEGFNTPLYPEVLIATGVLAEGIDLHRACRRVIHHDLPWNPAKLEQRTGRVDRIGSLSARLQQQHGDVPESAVDIGLPYVAGTYDETIFRRVLARRREFRCLLGNRPEWDKDELDAVGAEPICEAMVVGLQTHLGPTTVAAGPRRS